jgi:hypothetical protein
MAASLARASAMWQAKPITSATTDPKRTRSDKLRTWTASGVMMSRSRRWQGRRQIRLPQQPLAGFAMVEMKPLFLALADGEPQALCSGCDDLVTSRVGANEGQPADVVEQSSRVRLVGIHRHVRRYLFANQSRGKAVLPCRSERVGAIPVAEKILDSHRRRDGPEPPQPDIRDRMPHGPEFLTLGEQSRIGQVQYPNGQCGIVLHQGTQLGEGCAAGAQLHYLQNNRAKYGDAAQHPPDGVGYDIRTNNVHNSLIGGCTVGCMLQVWKPVLRWALPAPGALAPGAPADLDFRPQRLGSTGRLMQRSAPGGATTPLGSGHRRESGRRSLAGSGVLRTRLRFVVESSTTIPCV